MKAVLTLILITLVITCYGQGNRLNSMHPSLRRAIEELKKENVDTIFTYHYYCTGCDDLSETTTCTGFIDARIVWEKNGRVFSKKLSCDQKESIIKEGNSNALEYFIANRLQITTRKPLPNQKFYPSISVHYDAEEFTLFLKEEMFKIELFKEQKENKIWQKYSWIKPTLKLAELNNKEK